ncbi:MAG: DNA translocase FtsK [Oscillospiraceae bacterium]|nr:DNA translocase FtsK [Oscillospiraceae bacterium]
MENSAYEQAPTAYAQNQNGEIVLSLGSDANGEAFNQNLSSIPHFLVSGFSGAGKTSFVQSVMTHICSSQTEDDVRFIIYDSKAIDYSVFNGTPHMLLPVITDETKAAGAVLWLNTEVQRRIKALFDAGTKDIAGYNRRAATRLPRIFAIFDDFSSTRFDTQTVAALTNVLKNGRVAGVHCVLVTSMPSSQALQKDIISNLPCRISFCVSSRADSRVAIEQNGAENLQVPGEMIFKYQNIFAKCQALYVPFVDVQAAMKQLCKKQKKDLNQLGNMAANIFADEKTAQKETKGELDGDEMLPAAVDVVLETGQASVSMLQRRLKLGYARAARIVDEMEEMGIVGPFQGSIPREILITKQQWDAMRGVAPNPAVKQQSSAAAKRTVAEEPPIALRDFSEFSVANGTISIYGNEVHVSKKVMTRYGSGTTTAHFTGDSFSALIYKKPRLFSPGYIEFKFKDETDFTNNQPHLIDISQSDISEFLRSEFSSAQAKIVHLFLLQLAEDAHVPITEL